MRFEQKIKAFMEKENMLSPGMKVILGLSGGADSVALLQVLCGLRESMELGIAAVHIHHGIRAEAGEDVEFCRELCRQLQVPFLCEYADVPALAQEQGLSLEEAGRRVRYEAFEHHRSRLGYDVIAVAHHQNDQAETVLFQMFRGSGLRGLAGIPAKRDCIIRPLLTVTRREIEDYLGAGGLRYVTDATNEEDLYTRNRIRHHILPVAEEISAGAVVHMSQSCARIREVLQYMEGQAADFLEKYAQPAEKGICLSVEALSGQHIALQKQVIMSALQEALGSRRDITERHVEAVQGLLSKEGSKLVHLPYGGVARKEYDSLLITGARITDEGVGTLPREILPDTVLFLSDGLELRTRLFEANNFENIPENDCIKWFDYDKITETLSLRTREKGDFLTVRDDGARKSLQDYLVNEKVPLSERDRLPVLADGHHIVWIPGKRISAHYKVSGSTKRILEVYIGGSVHG